jgi:hypothetical protein
MRVMSQELLRGTFQVLDLENKGLIQLFFNLNRIRDIVAKALRSADQGRVTANSHELSFSIGLTDECKYAKLKGKNQFEKYSSSAYVSLIFYNIPI